MGVIDFIKRKREENKETAKELELYKKKLIMEMLLRGEKPRLTRTPEEIELEQYLEEERQAAIKKLVAKKRAERSLFGTFYFDKKSPPIKKIKFKKYSLGKITL